jgi:hypothetical protein
VVDCTGDRLRLLRAGALDWETVLAAVGPPGTVQVYEV